MSGFHETLRTAIEASRLTLQELADILSEQGTPVSPASLSAWQSGRSRPERPSSLRALHTLDRVLDLPAGTLRSSLPPRARRGRHDSIEGPGPPDVIDLVLTRLGATRADLVDGRLSTISLHQHVRVNDDRDVTAVAVSQLLRAREEVTRFVLIRWYDASGLAPSAMRVRGAVIRQAARHPTMPLFGYELLLPAPLSVGEVALLEFTETFTPGLSSADMSFRTLQGTRDLTLRVEFTGENPPATVEAYRRRSYRAPSHRHRPITVHRGTAQLALVDPEPGIHGLRWGDVSAEWARIGIAPTPT